VTRGGRGERYGSTQRAETDEDASADDELAGEDAKLRAMRSVWLAMRDEAPSDGGLAELLAAARDKAAELTARPTLWQRIVTGLRRPPVLAFATVLVLLSGAMVVGRHVEQQAMPTAASARDEAAPVREVGTAVPERQAQREVGASEVVRLAGSSAAATTTAANEASGDDVARPEVTAARPVTPPAPRLDDGLERGPAEPAVSRPPLQPKPPAPPMKAEGSRPVRAAPSRLAPAPRDEATAVSSTEPEAAPPGSAASGAVATDGEASNAGGAPGATADDKMKGATAPRASGSKTGASTSKDVSGSPSAVSQTGRAESLESEHKNVAKRPSPRAGATPVALYRRCEVAATRGDCVEVRRVVAQISTTDPTYRARIAKGSRIAACLAD